MACAYPQFTFRRIELTACPGRRANARFRETASQCGASLRPSGSGPYTENFVWRCVGRQLQVGSTCVSMRVERNTGTPRVQAPNAFWPAPSRKVGQSESGAGVAFCTFTTFAAPRLGSHQLARLESWITYGICTRSLPHRKNRIYSVFVHPGVGANSTDPFRDQLRRCRTTTIRCWNALRLYQNAHLHFMTPLPAVTPRQRLATYPLE